MLLVPHLPRVCLSCFRSPPRVNIIITVKRPKKPKYVKAGDLKSHNYRQIAMNNAKEKNIHFDKEDEAGMA
jgi:hypothetical protein